MMDTNKTDPKLIDDTTEDDQGVSKASRPRVLFGLDEAETDASEETNRKVQMQPTFSLDPEFLQRAPSPLTIRKMVSTPPEKYNTCPDLHTTFQKEKVRVSRASRYSKGDSEEGAISNEPAQEACKTTMSQTAEEKLMAEKQPGNETEQNEEVEVESDSFTEITRTTLQPTFSLDPEFLQRAPSQKTIREMVSSPPQKYNTFPNLHTTFQKEKFRVSRGSRSSEGDSVEGAISNEASSDTCVDLPYIKTKEEKIMAGKQSGDDEAEHSEGEFFDAVDSKVDFDDLKPINNSDQTTKSEPPKLTIKFQTQPSLSKCVVGNESLCIECVKPLQVVSKNDVQRGDHIGFAGKIYDHHAIVTEVYELRGSSPDIICLQMVHATNTSAKATFASLHPFGNKARLRKVEEIINFRQKRVVIYKYNSKINPFTPDEIVRRAISESDSDLKRGEGQFKYNLFKNNCEHFATWCVTGRKLSLQERKFTMVMWMFLSSGFRGISDEYQRHEKEYEYGMLCGACYQRNKKVLIVESRKILEASDITKGDVITYSYWNLWHDAVVLRVEKSSSSDFVKCQIAHYAFQYFDYRKIIKEELCIPLDGTVTKKIYPDNLSVFPADEVVKRAEQRLDEQEFAFFSNDSCQFCRWCKLKLKPD